jgi:hypothetical protein
VPWTMVVAMAELPAGGDGWGLAPGRLLAHDDRVNTPSRADRHTARLARLRRARRLAAGGVVLGLAAGLSLALGAEERPLRVVGILVLAINLLMVPALVALFRAEQRGREDR